MMTWTTKADVAPRMWGSTPRCCVGEALNNVVGEIVPWQSHYRIISILKFPFKRAMSFSLC